MPEIDPSLDFWVDLLEGFARAFLQNEVDQAWLERKMGGFPPTVQFDEIEPLELLGLRFRGRGTAGLEAVRDVARDRRVREFAEGLLGVRPWPSEDVPG